MPLHEILSELSAIPDSTEKLKFLLALAADLPEFPENEKIPKNKIQGCASNAYLVSEMRDGKIFPARLKHKLHADLFKKIYRLLRTKGF